MSSPAELADDAAAQQAPGRRWPLVTPIPGSAFWGWAGPLLITALGAFLRFSRLGAPKAVIFDETYYVPDAYGILKHGVEIVDRKPVNPLLVAGNTHIFNGIQGEYVAHPPLGKIMIAVGEWAFGLTPVGWRFAVAVVGTLAVLMTARIARRMTRSTLLGCAAGLLLALDGLELVLSRTAILDIFVMFWVLAAFGLLVLDRDWSRARLQAALATAGTEDAAGPKLGARWRLLLAGVCLGLACASKWSGVWYIPAFAVLVLAWELGARRAAGFSARFRGVLRSDAKWLPLWFGLLPAVAYTAAWTGWFASSLGYDRNGAALNGGVPTSTLVAWYQYGKSMLTFGLGLSSHQAYQSNPTGWLFLTRPTAFYSACLPAHACGAAGSTEQEVLAIGTPAIWWAAGLALVACLVLWRVRRDWRAGAVLLMVAAGWLPWIWFYYHDHRTEFYFYSVVMDPFLVIAITLCLGLIIGQARATPVRRTVGAVVAGAYLLAVLADFAYMYPILTAQVIPYSTWLSHMWYHGWI
jgi:dolichyl-phosphate-mannose-protein mannosyltransferase